MSYKVEVKVGKDPWCGNGLRFATPGEAELYGAELLVRWLLPSAYRVVESSEQPNYQVVNGRVEQLTPGKYGEGMNPYRMWVMASTSPGMLALAQATGGWSKWGQDILALYAEMREAELGG